MIYSNSRQLSFRKNISSLPAAIVKLFLYSTWIFKSYYIKWPIFRAEELAQSLFLLWIFQICGGKVTKKWIDIINSNINFHFKMIIIVSIYSEYNSFTFEWMKGRSWRRVLYNKKAVFFHQCFSVISTIYNYTYSLSSLAQWERKFWR